MIQQLPNEEKNSIGLIRWQRALPFSVLISAVILSFYFYWFVIANRYLIFLYTHLGAGPFDGLTNGRYWMAGFVATGFIMVGYTIFNWYLARIAGLRYRTYHPPVWWHVWLLCLLPNTIGIFVITMPLGRPPLTFNLMFALGLTTAIGLAFALQPSQLVVKRPFELVWLAVASVGLMPALLLLRAVELPSRGLANTEYALILGVATPIMGFAWVVVVSWAHTKFTTHNWKVFELLIAGFCFCYLLLPIVHHIFFTPPNGRYITTSGNFFAEGWLIQLAAIATTVFTAFVAVQVGKRATK